MAVLFGILLVLIAGIGPMVAYALILWWFDRYEKEPLGLLLAAFLWGAIPAIVLSLIVELILDIPISSLADPMAANLVGVAVVAPITEEIFKGVALLLLFIFFRREIDGLLDGIVYGGLVGFGFAAVENVFYFADTLIESGTVGMALLTFFRAFLFGLNHAMFTGFIGLGLALASTTSSWVVRMLTLFLGLAAGITAHAIHNGSVMLGAEFIWPCLIAFLSNWGGVVILLGSIVWATVQEQRRLIRLLADEVSDGRLSQRDYEIICSYWRRVGERLKALMNGDFRRWWELGRYYHLATELAFSKYRLTRSSHREDAQEVQTQIMRLRERVAAQGDRL